MKYFFLSAVDKYTFLYFTDTLFCYLNFKYFYLTHYNMLLLYIYKKGTHIFVLLS